MLTAKEFAEETGISYPVVIDWLKDGKIPEAEQTSFRIWQIPATVVDAFKKPENRPKRGRPLKAAEADKNQGAETAAVKESPAKPKKLKASKRAGAKKASKTGRRISTRIASKKSTSKAGN